MGVGRLELLVRLLGFLNFVHVLCHSQDALLVTISVSWFSFILTVPIQKCCG